jgi:hypothetical protein
MNDEKGPAVPWLAIIPVIAIFAVGVVFYGYLALGWKAHTAPTWGALGDAVGPFVAVLNVVALFAALWSVALQRHELELQRQELRATREEMKGQRAQFERTAIAQEALAKSQQQLADAQGDANVQGLRRIEAEYAASVASLIAAQASFALGRTSGFGRESGHHFEQMEKRFDLDGVSTQLRESKRKQEKSLEAIRREIAFRVPRIVLPSETVDVSEDVET